MKQPTVPDAIFILEVLGHATTSSAFDCGSDAKVMGGSAQVVRFSCGLGTIGAIETQIKGMSEELRRDPRCDKRSKPATMTESYSPWSP